MKIVFFANHELALPSFYNLLQKEMLVGLVNPNYPHEANLRMQAVARDKKIPAIYVDKKAVHSTLEGWLAERAPDAIFVMTFPFILPPNIFGLPRLGCFNWHTGILPQYRGPDPVFWEFLNGEKEGGVTVHMMEKELDTGPIVKIEKIKITKDQTYGEHYKKLAAVSSELVDYILSMLMVDPEGIEPVPQDKALAKYYGRPAIKDMFIRWQTDSADRISKVVRVTNPMYGGARTFFRQQPLSVFQVTLDRPRGATSIRPGTITAAGSKDGLVVMSSDGVPVRLDSIYCEEGFYSGHQFVKVFDVKRGEVFLDPK